MLGQYLSCLLICVLTYVSACVSGVGSDKVIRQLTSCAHLPAFYCRFLLSLECMQHCKSTCWFYEPEGAQNEAHIHMKTVKTAMPANQTLLVHVDGCYLHVVPSASHQQTAVQHGITAVTHRYAQ